MFSGIYQDALKLQQKLSMPERCQKDAKYWHENCQTGSVTFNLFLCSLDMTL